MISSKSKEIQIKEILIALLKRWWVILLTTAILGGFGTFYQSENQAEPLYSATSSVIVQENNMNLNTLKVLVTEPIVLEEVVANPLIESSAKELRNKITVSNEDNSSILKIEVTGASPEEATEAANLVATVFPQVVSDRLGYSGISQLSEALIQDSRNPINAPSTNISRLSIVLGIAAGIGLALLLNSIDYRIKSEREVEKIIGIPVLGSVTKIKKTPFKNSLVEKKRAAVRGETIV